MSEIMTPGAPTGIPAGYATQTLVGGQPTLLLTPNVAAADVIELTGALTGQDIVVAVPAPLFPTQVVGSNTTGSYSGPTGFGWAKIFKNSTTGPFNVVLQCQNGPNTLPIPQGETFWAFSPDGLSIFQGSGASGTTVVINNALAAGIIYRPGGVLSENVFPTWPQVMTAFSLTQGHADIEIDSSIVSPAPIPVGIYDMQGRATITGRQDGVAIPQLDIAAGAQLISVDFEGLLLVTTHGTVAVPTIVQNRATQAQMLCENAVFFTHLGTGPWLGVAAGGFADVQLKDQCAFNNSAAGAGPLMGLGAGASGVLETINLYPGAFNTGANSIVSGAAGTNIQFDFDSSWQAANPPSTAGFGGTVTLLPIDHISKTQTFTALGNFTVPDGVTEVEVELCGGGGGGGGGITGAVGASTAGAGGGAGAPMFKRTVTGLAARQVIAVAVGAGGLGGATGAGPGTDGGVGGNSSFGVFAVGQGASGGQAAQAAATGGLGGMANKTRGNTNVFALLTTTAADATFAQAGGGGGSATQTVQTGGQQDDLFNAGVAGTNGGGGANQGFGGGGGGAGPYGNGGAGGNGGAAPGPTAGTAGTAALANTGGGGGGGGSGSNGGVGAAGGNGGSGFVKITWRLST
jgi:hypothetical protein